MILKFFSKPTPSTCGKELAEHRCLNDRARYRARARQMCIDMGRPVPKALK